MLYQVRILLPLASTLVHVALFHLSPVTPHNSANFISHSSRFSCHQASVMVEYSYEEAVALLESNLATALDKQV